MAALLSVHKEKLWRRDMLWVFSQLSHAATQQLLWMSLAGGGCVLYHIKGCGRTFNGLTLAVTSCLPIADKTLLVLAQILGSLNELFAIGSTYC